MFSNKFIGPNEF